MSFFPNTYSNTVVDFGFMCSWLASFKSILSLAKFNYIVYSVCISIILEVKSLPALFLVMKFSYIWFATNLEYIYWQHLIIPSKSLSDSYLTLSNFIFFIRNVYLNNVKTCWCKCTLKNKGKYQNKSPWIL